MNDWEIQEELQKNQQRFEAALKIYLQRGKRYPGQASNIKAAIEEADTLIAKLEETKT